MQNMVQNKKEAVMGEKVHKTMSWTGALNIAAGIISIAVGITTGILLLVSGGRLLADRKKLLF